MPTFEIPEMGITISVDRSSASDHAPVIFIDTDERLGEEGPQGPKIRVHVNDGEVFKGVPRGEEPEGIPPTHRRDQCHASSHRASPAR